MRGMGVGDLFHAYHHDGQPLKNPPPPSSPRHAGNIPATSSVPLPRRVSMSCYRGCIDDSGSRWMTGPRRTRQHETAHRGWVQDVRMLPRYGWGGSPSNYRSMVRGHITAW